MRCCSAELVAVLTACALGSQLTSAQKLGDLAKLKPQHLVDKVKKQDWGALAQEGQQHIESVIPEGQTAAKTIQQGQEIAMEGAKKLAGVAATAAELGAASNATGSPAGVQSTTPTVDTPTDDTAERTGQDDGIAKGAQNVTGTQEVVAAVTQGLEGAKEALESSSGVKKFAAAIGGLPKPDKVKEGVTDLIKKTAPTLKEAVEKPTPAEAVKHLLNESSEVVGKEGQAVKDAVESKVKDVLKSPDQVKGAGEQVKDVLKEPAEQVKDALKEPAEQAQQALKKADSKVAGTIEKNAPGLTEALKKAPTDEVQKLIKETGPETVDSIKKASPTIAPTKALPSSTPGGSTPKRSGSWQWTLMGMFVAAAALVCGWYLFGRIKGREGRAPTLLVESEMSPWNLSGQPVRGRPVAEEPLFRQF